MSRNLVVMDMNTSNRRFDTMDEYIMTFSPDVRNILEDLREAIRDSVPTAEETIAYGIPTFKLNGNLVHFAAFKHHIGFYPGGPSAIEAFKKELVQYKQSKGTIQFPLDRPIPLELVKRIVQFRVKENASLLTKKHPTGR